jgi:hypothetical protein
MSLITVSIFKFRHQSVIVRQVKPIATDLAGVEACLAVRPVYLRNCGDDLEAQFWNAAKLRESIGEAFENLYYTPAACPNWSANASRVFHRRPQSQLMQFWKSVLKRIMSVTCRTEHQFLSG